MEKDESKNIRKIEELYRNISSLEKSITKYRKQRIESVISTKIMLS